MRTISLNDESFSRKGLIGWLRHGHRAVAGGRGEYAVGRDRIFFKVRTTTLKDESISQKELMDSAVGEGFCLNKQEMVDVLKVKLKMRGFRKKGQYWHRVENDVVYCVNVQGSQWDSNDYYVNVGAAKLADSGNSPTLTNWYLQKRIHDAAGEDRNPELEAVLEGVEFFCEFHTAEELDRFIQSVPHSMICGWYEI